MTRESKTRYKMYKDGKRWVFCGLTTVGLLVGLGTLNVQASADTVSENVVANTSSKQIDKKTVVSNQETKTSTEVTAAPKDDIPTSNASENTSINPTTTETTDSVHTDENSATTSESSKDITTTKDTGKKDNSKSNTKSNNDSVKTNATAEKSTANTNSTESTKEESVTNDNSSNVTVDHSADNNTTDVSSTNTSAVSDNTKNNQNKATQTNEGTSTVNINNDIDTSKTQSNKNNTNNNDVSKTLPDTVTNENKKNVDSQKKKDEAKKESTQTDDNIASGTFGTSDWYIDAQGTLHFGAGEFGISQFDASSIDALSKNKNGWGAYADQIKKISFDDRVKANQQSGGLFNGLSNLTSVENMQNFDTSTATVMDAMFWDDKKLTTIDVSNWNVTNVYSMYGTFYNCASVSNLDVSNWNIDKIVNMDYTFDGMVKLEALDVSGWDTSNMESMFYTFYNDELISVLDVSGWNVSKVKDFNGTFSGMKGLKTLDVSKWDTSSATTMDSLFQETRSLSVLDVSNFNVSNVTSMTFTFMHTGAKTLDVSGWDVSKVSNFRGIFETVNLDELDVSNWNTESATNMSYMFGGSSSFGTLNVSNLNTDNVVTMEHMFSGINVKKLDLSSFNTSNVTNMEGMFNGAKNIYKLDISDFDMGKVTNEKTMLTGLTSLRVLVLGPNTVINSAELSEPNFKGTSNRWVAVAGGTENDPHGATYYTSANLMSSYNSSMTDTYVIGEDKSSIAGHDSTIIAGPNSKWSPSDNFTSGTGIDGSPLDFNKVVVTGNVDTTTPGDYEITYTYTDEVGKEVVDTITVHVVASQVSVDGHDSTIIAGPNSKWSANDNFDSATDAEGNPVEFKDVTVSGRADPQTPGNYDITYSYTDAYGNTASKTVTVHVIESQTSVDGHDSTIIAGPNSKWDAKDNFDGATDVDGNPVELKDVKVNGKVDPQTPGDYKVTYSYTDAYGNTASKTVTVHVIESQASVDGHDSTIIAGPNSKWSASDNFDNATDAEGNQVDFKDVAVSGQADPQTPGNYNITYSYTDDYGNMVSKTITVHVVASQISIDGHDSTIIAGPNSTWSAKDNFDNATDAEGNSVEFKNVTVSGTVDSQTPGDYKVTYSYTDSYGNMASETVTVHVIESQTSVDGHDSTIIAGPNSKWDAKDNFDGATDVDGNPVELKDVKVTGEADPQTPGNYEITYSYTDTYGNTASKTVTVHVIASQVSVDGHDSTIIAGPNSKWDSKDNFDSATDTDGNPVELKDVKVTGKVDAQTSGDYDITYSYTDVYGNVASKTITVHVIDSQVNIDGHDSTIIAGPNSKWDASDNFDNATDAEGNQVELKDVTVSGKVVPQTPGNYEITYSYTDAYGNTASKTITVHVIASQANVDGHDSTIIAGPNSKWNAKDNFDGATDANGDSVELKDVTVGGQADSQTPGNYEITYSYTDAYGNTASKTITVHVIASQANVDGHDSTIIAGPNSKWNASDNFNGATDAKGNPVNFKDITVNGEVDSTVVGNYDVTYSYTDAYGNTVSKTITVHVIASQVSVNGHDSTIIAGPNSKWDAKDNFNSATDAEGNPVEFEDVKVSGEVNPHVPSDYEVTYSYTDSYGNTASKTVTVHVIASQVSVDGHDSTIIAGPDSKWDAKDNFNEATDAEGNSVDLKDVKVSGKVNPQIPGDYEVTYSYTDVYGNTASVTITVHVIASEVSVDGHDSTIIAGSNSNWNANDNFENATDAEGNPVKFEDVKVSGKANPQVPGDYEVTYSYTDAYGNTASKTITIHVIASQVSVDGHDSTIIAGPNSKWDAKDNFNGATDAEGNPVKFEDVTANGKVDSQTPGDYKITYSYTDTYGNMATKTITVHVIASQASVNGHGSTIIAGPNSTWSTSDNFVNATDAEGNLVKFEDVKVSGEVNPHVPGDYEVTYSYTDTYGNMASKTVTVHVIASQASVDGHDSTITADPDNKWSASDNFDSATNAEGNPVDFNDVEVSGEVDATMPEDYDVTYSYTDAYGNIVSETVTVHVVASQNPDTPDNPSTPDVPDTPESPNKPDVPDISDTPSEPSHSNTADVPATSEPNKTTTTTNRSSLVNVAPAKKQNTTISESKTNTLPQTGESNSNAESAMGVLGLLAGVMGILGLGKRRRNREN